VPLYIPFVLPLFNASTSLKVKGFDRWISGGEDEEIERSEEDTEEEEDLPG